VDGQTVGIAQATRYPWDGRIRLTVSPAAPRTFTLMVRLPGWSRNEALPGGLYRFTGDAAPAPGVAVNGVAVPVGVLESGYLPLRREWTKGDTVDLDLPMPVRRLAARDEVRADTGRVALQRGPLVYAAEWPDNGGRALDLAVGTGDGLEPQSRPDVLGGIVGITVSPAAGPSASAPPVHMIPYYAWAHRGKGEMAVWLKRTP
jgi:hypothetical protein